MRDANFRCSIILIILNLTVTLLYFLLYCRIYCLTYSRTRVCLHRALHRCISYQLLHRCISYQLSHAWLVASVIQVLKVLQYDNLLRSSHNFTINVCKTSKTAQRNLPSEGARAGARCTRKYTRNRNFESPDSVTASPTTDHRKSCEPLLFVSEPVSLFVKEIGYHKTP